MCNRFETWPSIHPGRARGGSGTAAPAADRSRHDCRPAGGHRNHDRGWGNRASTISPCETNRRPVSGPRPPAAIPGASARRSHIPGLGSDIVGIEVFHRPRFVPRCQSQTFRQRVQSTTKHGQHPLRARDLPAAHPRRHNHLGRGEGKGRPEPGGLGVLTGAFFWSVGSDTPAAGISAPMTSLRAPRGIQRREVGSPLGGVALAGKILERADLTFKRHPPKLGLGLLVCCMIAKTFAVRLCRRDRGGRYRRIMARPQISVAITVAGLPRPALAPLARH